MADNINENSVPAEGEAILEVKNLNKYFSVETNFFGKPIKFLKAVDGVSFSLQRGKTLGIVGESGCGKTTLGRTILRLYDITSGEVRFKGKNVSNIKNREFDKLRPNMQMIFQDPYASLSPRLTVGEIIGEAARQHKIVDKAHYRDYIIEVMKMCGLQPHYFERYPHEFSGGQRQRICIARALALKPELVICDEPVSALDVSIQAQIINMLIELRKSLGLTYVFISHDLSVVKHISDEVGVMYLGSMVEYGSKRDIFDNTLHPYTKALFSAVPVPNPHVKMNRIILKGDIPSPVNPPKGCKFHARCESCMEICTRLKPIYKEIEPGHFCACHLYDTEEEIKQLEEEYLKEQQELAEKQEKQSKWRFWEKFLKKGNKAEQSAEENKQESVQASHTESKTEEKQANLAPNAEVTEDAADEIPTVSKETASIDMSAISDEVPVDEISMAAEEKAVAEILAPTAEPVVEGAAASEDRSEETKNLAEEQKPAVKKPAVRKTTSSTVKKPASTTRKTSTSTAKRTTSTSGTRKTTSSSTAKKTTSTVKKSNTSTVKKTSAAAKKTVESPAENSPTESNSEVNNVPKE